MAFTAGIKAQKQFNNNGTTNNQNKTDRLVTVVDYDTTKGYIYVEDSKSKNYEVFINPEEVLRSNQSLAAKKQDISKINWMGHSIDEKMKKAIPIGSKVILIKSRVVQNDKTRNLAQTEVHRIGGVPAPDADKTFQGLFTVTYTYEEGRERISRIQHWNPNGVDINNEEGLQNLKELIDVASANYGVKLGEYSITEPTVGIQFRALLKTDQEYEYATDPTKKTIYEVVDLSLPFDWMPGPEDEEGKEIKSKAHVISGEEMMSFAEQYIEYITNNPSFKDNLADMKVEVAYYHVYPASKGSDGLILTTGDAEKDKHADKNPLYQLSHRQSFIDLAQTVSIIGRNAAVNGIIQISANKLEKVDGKPVEIPSYWANKLHANNTRGHIHSFIRTEDGYKTVPNEALALIKTEQQTNAKTTTTSSSSSASKAQEYHEESASVSDVSSSVMEENEFDPFASTDDSVEDTTPQKVETAPIRFGAKS
jgi:hypothetical protein